MMLETFIVSLAVIGLALLLSLHFFLTPFRPRTDQGWILQAAVRHAAGQGLTSQLGNPVETLTEPEFSRLTYFPPLFPIFVAWTLKLGAHVDTCVKVIKESRSWWASPGGFTSRDAC